MMSRARPPIETVVAAFHEAEETKEAVPHQLALQMVYRWCIDAMEDRQLWWVEMLLDRLNPEKLSIATMLAPLSITVPIREEIPGSHHAYFMRVSAELDARKVENKQALLAGLCVRGD